MAKQAGLDDINIVEKVYDIDVLGEYNDQLYRQVKGSLPSGEKLSDYIVSIDVTARRADGNCRGALS